MGGTPEHGVGVACRSAWTIAPGGKYAGGIYRRQWRATPGRRRPRLEYGVPRTTLARRRSPCCGARCGSFRCSRCCSSCLCGCGRRSGPPIRPRSQRCARPSAATTTHSGARIRRPSRNSGRRTTRSSIPPGAATRADRLANLRAGRTAFDSLAPVLAEERIRAYGDKDVVAVHTTLLSIGGRYSRAPSGAGTARPPSGSANTAAGSRWPVS